MGIQGLLPQLKSIMVPIHIQDLKGHTVAVDTYSWLHKGALSCSTNLCKGIPATKHIDYCMHRVNLLRHHGVKPILVFDGGFLPMKIDQETKRSRARKENLERAMEHEAAGNLTAAFECYQKSVDISPSVALGLIKVLKQEKVDYIVAPYEADAQMTFLCINGHVDAVITEDSDLIPFGCSRIIFKMDKFGQGVQFQSSMLSKNKELDFSNFTKQMLLEMCILSGCDYLQSLPGMGLKRAHALVQKFKSYEKVIKHLKYSAISVPPLYEENFRKAIWAFQHQRVYDPKEEEIVHLSDVPPDVDDELDFLGPWLAPTVVKGIAEGNLDPFTKLPFQVEATGTEQMLDKPYAVKESVYASGKKKIDLPVQKNVLTNYFCLASLEAKRKFRAPKVMPKGMTTVESPSPSSENHESDASGSTEEITPITNHQHGSLSLKDLDEDFAPKDSLIFHQKQFRTPKIMPKCMVPVESLSPIPDRRKSSPTTDDIPTIDIKQHSLNLSRDLHCYLPSKDSIEATFSNESNKTVELHLHAGSTVTSPFSDESFGQNLMRHKGHGCNNELDATEQENSAFGGDKRYIKSSTTEVIKRSKYFLHMSPDKYGNNSQNEELVVNRTTDDLNDKHPLATVTSIRNGYPKSAVKKRKLLHPFNTLSESEAVRKSRSDSVEEGDHIHNFTNMRSNGKVQGKLACDVSHVNRYSGIAEKSMEKFASLISSFRYTGSRASGLRAPLKDVQNTCPVRSTVAPIDFDKYVYKPKNKSV